MDGGLKLSYNGIKGRYAQATGAVKTVPLSLALSGTLRNYVSYDPNNLLMEDQSTWGNGIAVDAMIPVVPFDGQDSPSVLLTGEYSTGSGYGDMYPNWTGGLSAMGSKGVTYNSYYLPNLDAGIAGFDPNNKNAFTLIQLSSWNGQVQIHGPKSWGTCLTVGYGELFSPNVGGMLSAPNAPVTTLGYFSAATLYNDDAVIFGNIMQDLTPNIRLAVEYARIDTHYANTNGVMRGEPHLFHRQRILGVKSCMMLPNVTAVASL